MMSQDEAQALITKHVTFGGLEAERPELVSRMRFMLKMYLTMEPDKVTHPKGRGCNSGPETSPEGGQSKRSYPK